MSTIAVLGCMFGDEAKAKIVDVLAQNADMVVRFQGGSNAGHTIAIDDKKYVLHLIPSGILYRDKICALGSGVALDPFGIVEEMKNLEQKGISFNNRFFIDPRVHLVLPFHKEVDSRNENDSRKTKIGTTKRGIGPCYADRASRVGIRFGDLYKDDFLKSRLYNFYNAHNVDNPEDIVENLLKELKLVTEKLKPFIKQIPYLLNKYKKEDKMILFEGAQGTLLDVDYGTYPYVTSSHTCAGGISIGSGFATRSIDKIIGVYKSYFTRVGAGPFPTELFNDVGEKIRIQGNEFGSTTGRPRRCGWFDSVASKFTAMINGIDEIALTLLDVLKGIDKIKICVAYKIDGKITKEFPYHVPDLEKIEPIYEELEGWEEDISEIKSFDRLPENAKKYVNRIEELLERNVYIVSVGPRRDQTIFR